MAPTRWEFEAIGTWWQIDAEMEAPDDAYAEIRERIAAFDANYSRFRADSLVSAIAKKPGRYEMPADWAALWELYEKLYRATDGAMSPLVGTLLEDLGYDAAYSFAPHAPRPVPALSSARYEYPYLVTTEPVLIDIGAAGKGYLIDIVSDILKRRGASTFTVDAGGDMYRFGQGIEVALEDPEDASLAIGIVSIANESICASAWNRRRWGAHHHIVDPRTGNSPKDILATWTIARDARTADALATALFFTDPSKLGEFSFEYVIMRADRSVRYSPRFAQTFFDKRA